MDYYKILGLTPSASEEEIKKSYKKLAMKYHPDRSVNLSDIEKKKNEEKFKEINDAYQHILNKKNEPDDLFNKYSQEFNNKNMDDIMNYFYKYKGSTKNNKGDNSYSKDIFLDLNIPLETYFIGGEYEVTFSTNLNCENCNGSGVFSNRLCPKCYGRGTNKIRIKTSVKIPEKTLKLKTEVNENNKTFNLNINIILDKNDKFRIDQKNIYSKINVPYYKAILGGDVDYKFLDGKTYNIKVNPLTESGKMIRLKNKGIDGGDLILEFNIIIDVSKITENEIIKLKEIYK